MEKVLNDLHVKLYEELSQYCQHGINSHEDADVVNDLLASIKNIYKIKKYMEEEQGSEMERNMGYSGRMNYQNSGRDNRVMYEMGNSYGYSYLPPYYEAPQQRQEKSWLLTPKWGYSGTSKEDMIEHLSKMMEEAEDPKVKKAISECITSLNK